MFLPPSTLADSDPDHPKIPPTWGWYTGTFKVGVWVSEVVNATDYVPWGKYALTSVEDRVIATNSDGVRGHDLFFYRPGSSTGSLKRIEADGSVSTIADFRGIAGFIPQSTADCAISVNFDGDADDDLFFYRPGQRVAYLARSNGHGVYMKLYASKTSGIAGYDLASNEQAGHIRVPGLTRLDGEGVAVT